MLWANPIREHVIGLPAVCCKHSDCDRFLCIVSIRVVEVSACGVGITFYQKKISYTYKNALKTYSLLYSFIQL